MELSSAQQAILDSIKLEISIARHYRTFEAYAAAELRNIRDIEPFRKPFELRLNGCVTWASNSPLHYLQNRGYIQIIKNGYSEGVDIVRLIERKNG